MPLNVNNQKGYIALIAILIIVTATLAISVSINILSIGETQVGLYRQQSAQSFALADACVEEAYIRIQRDNAYAGGNLNLSFGSCTITVVSSGADRTITAAAVVDSIERRIESEVTIVGNNLALQYWKALK